MNTWLVGVRVNGAYITSARLGFELPIEDAANLAAWLCRMIETQEGGAELLAEEMAEARRQ